MITKFDKNGAAALYKREFIAAVRIEDFERAIDKLLRYAEVTGYPDFHLALGMLYLQMTLDSDDHEFPVLAFREFMIHLSKRPDCRDAYRDLLAVAMVRRDPMSVIDFGEYIKHRGLDLTKMLNELSEIGLDMFTDDESFIDFPTLFPCESYGEIGYRPGFKPDAPSYMRQSEKSKKAQVIPFRGAYVKKRTDKDPVAAFKADDLSDEDDDFDANDMFEMMMQMARDEVDTTDDGASVDGDEITEMNAEMRDRMALRDAEHACDERDFAKALAILDTIGRDNDHIYYCSECVRANILSELGDYKKAQDSVDRAYDLVPNGSLVGIVQCRLYELQEKFSLIPETLKNINVHDYIDVDHAFSALMLAVKYCTQDDALLIASEYADEFNAIDMRLMYAQLLYNSGEREEAVKEFYALTRLVYDDFNLQYYYLSARSGIVTLPIAPEAPQNILGLMIDNLIAAVNSDAFKTDDMIIASEPVRYATEMFLSLEFDNTRSVMRVMFDTLRALASDGRAAETMQNALVSPYVEPLVKAVILSELLKNGQRVFLTEVAFCPVHSDFLPELKKDARPGLCDAYALAVMFLRSKADKAIALAETVYKVAGDNFPERDVACYVWRSVCSSRKPDSGTLGRIDYALGYKTKAEANASFKRLSAFMDAYGNELT